MASVRRPNSPVAETLSASDPVGLYPASIFSFAQALFEHRSAGEISVGRDTVFLDQTKVRATCAVSVTVDTSAKDPFPNLFIYAKPTDIENIPFHKSSVRFSMLLIYLLLLLVVIRPLFMFHVSYYMGNLYDKNVYFAVTKPSFAK